MRYSRHFAGIACVTAALGITLMTASTASAATASLGITDTATTQAYRFNAQSKGRLASIFKQVSTAKVCADGSKGSITTYVYIDTSEMRYHSSGAGSPVGSNDLYVNISRFNTCNGKYTSGFGWMTPDAVGINGSLSAASASGTVSMCNYSSNFSTWWAPYATKSTVSVNWTATSPKVTDTYTWKFRAPDFRIRAKFSGTFRQAKTTGSITYQGTKLDLATDGLAPLTSPAGGVLLIPNGWASIGTMSDKVSEYFTFDLLPPPSDPGDVPPPPPVDGPDVSSCGYGVPMPIGPVA